MSSSGFNIGLTNGRNSSRVLKPPGGGHTDIFGHEVETPMTRRRRSPCRIYEKTQIGSCLEWNDTKVERAEKEVTDGEKKQQVVDENTKPAAEAGEAAKRVRVPPGGFSSGFW